MDALNVEKARKIFADLDEYRNLIEMNRKSELYCDQDVNYQGECCDFHRAMKARFEKLIQDADEINTELEIGGRPYWYQRARAKSLQILPELYPADATDVMTLGWFHRLSELSGVPYTFPY